MQPVMVARVAATQATVDAWKGKTFRWGRNDCARLAASHLTRLGYAPRIARFGFYTAPLAAARALKREGFATAAEWMDDIGLPRIPPASALPGDIMGFGHEDQPLRVGLAIVVGNGRALGFMNNGDGVKCHVFPPIMTAPDVDYLAWRAAPLPQEAP